MTTTDTLTLADALELALEWIDAVPSETPLPTMPGFDRDAVNDALAAHRRASQAAPAPSDGLREAVARRILDDAISSVEDDMRADLEDAEDTGEHVDVGQYEIVLSYETAQTIRAALTPAPAQEGGE